MKKRKAELDATATPPTLATPKNTNPSAPQPAAPKPARSGTPPPKNVTPAQTPQKKVAAKPNNGKLGNEFLHRIFALRKKLYEEHKYLLNNPAKVP